MSDADRALLRDSIRDLLAARWPVSLAVSKSDDPQAIASLWRELSTQELTSLGANAAGGGLRELMLVFEELGRASCCVHMLGAMIANIALAPRCNESKTGDSATEAAFSLMDDIGLGKALVAAAFGAYDGDHGAGRVAVRGDRPQRSLDGRIAFVEGAPGATHIIVFTDAPPGIAIVAADARGLSILETPGLAVPALCELTFRNTPAMWISAESDALWDLVLVAKLACAARANGAAQRSFELAVDHARFRRQFGRLIGQFQAIQHKLANCQISLDGSRLALEAAADAYDRGEPTWRMLGAAALAFASPSIREVSVQAICALGAIGYAEEHEAPRHFRRVHADLARFGGAPRARADLADRVLGAASHAGFRTAESAAMTATASAIGCDAGTPIGGIRQEFRAWLEENWTAERRDANARLPFAERHWDPEFSRLMGKDGWIGVGWPKEHGGRARSASEQVEFIEELVSARVPYHAHNISGSIVARALFAHGSPEQKAEFLPAILRGERFFALGYSEPEAGSDLASLRTRAVKDGDDWIINGQKLWSTNCDKADYVWLAARTDPELEQHAGISVFILNLRSPGITIRPSMALYGRTFCTVHYDNVRAPSRSIVGGLNNGWKVVTGALIEELIMLAGLHMAIVKRAFDKLTDFIRTTPVGDRALRNDPVVRDRIGALAAEIEVARQLLLRNTRMAEQGQTQRYEAAISKIFLSELQERLGQAALDILGTGGLLSEDSDRAPVGELEQVLRHSMMPIIGGGTNEIQRTQIALRGLGLPR